MGDEVLGTAAIFSALTGAIGWLAKRLIDRETERADACLLLNEKLQERLDAHAARVEAKAEEMTADLAEARLEAAVLKAKVGTP